MSKTDVVFVQPTSTYFEGAEHKHPGCLPYKATRAHASELEANGIAKIVEYENPDFDAVDPNVAEKPVEQPVEQPAAEPERERPNDSTDASAAASPPRGRGRGRPRTAA